MGFELDKKNSLGKVDKSKKGGVDKDIKKLIKLINNSDNYYTSSSCSGRIVLIERDKSGRKELCKWLLVSHDKVNLRQVKDALKKMGKNTVW